MQVENSKKNCAEIRKCGARQEAPHTLFAVFFTRATDFAEIEMLVVCLSCKLICGLHTGQMILK